MKRVLFAFTLLLPSLLFLKFNAYPAVYEASTLHNAVARSETVQELFF